MRSHLERLRRRRPAACTIEFARRSIRPEMTTAVAFRRALAAAQRRDLRGGTATRGTPWAPPNPGRAEAHTSGAIPLMACFFAGARRLPRRGDLVAASHRPNDRQFAGDGISITAAPTSMPTAPAVERIAARGEQFRAGDVGATLGHMSLRGRRLTDLDRTRPTQMRLSPPDDAGCAPSGGAPRIGARVASPRHRPRAAVAPMRTSPSDRSTGSTRRRAACMSSTMTAKPSSARAGDRPAHPLLPPARHPRRTGPAAGEQPAAGSSLDSDMPDSVSEDGAEPLRPSQTTAPDVVDLLHDFQPPVSTTGRGQLDASRELCRLLRPNRSPAPRRRPGRIVEDGWLRVSSTTCSRGHARGRV